MEINFGFVEICKNKKLAIKQVFFYNLFSFNRLNDWWYKFATHTKLKNFHTMSEGLYEKNI